MSLLSKRKRKYVFIVEKKEKICLYWNHMVPNAPRASRGLGPLGPLLRALRGARRARGARGDAVGVAAPVPPLSVRAGDAPPPPLARRGGRRGRLQGRGGRARLQGGDAPGELGLVRHDLADDVLELQERVVVAVHVALRLVEPRENLRAARLGAHARARAGAASTNILSILFRENNRKEGVCVRDLKEGSSLAKVVFKFDTYSHRMKKAALLLRVYELGVSLKAQARKTRRAMRRMREKNEGLVRENTQRIQSMQEENEVLVRKNVSRCFRIMEADKATLVEKHAAQVAALVQEQDARVAALVRENTQRIKIMEANAATIMAENAARVAAVSGQRDEVFAALKRVLAERGG
jgi:hypothetical protein